jgi:CrcB protein
MAGASGRYALELAWPPGHGTLPWATLVTNVSGCLLIGVLMVCVLDGRPAALRHPLARPFLGVGVLGGYTTFSTYTVQTDALLAGGRPLLALCYLIGTLVAALAAVLVGAAAARTIVRGPGRRRG